MKSNLDIDNIKKEQTDVKDNHSDNPNRNYFSQDFKPPQFFSNPSQFNFTNQLFLNTHQSMLNNLNLPKPYVSPSLSKKYKKSNSQSNSNEDAKNSQDRKLCNGN